MASSSISVPCPKTTAALVVPSSQPLVQSRHGRLSFPLGSTFSGLQWPSRKGSSISMVRAQLNEVAAKESVNHSASADSSKTTDAQLDEKTDAPKGRRVPDSASLSEFMEQVSDLVKLVDSRDIMELKLKQLDCEIEIRKKEALPQPPTPPPVMMMQSPYQQHAMPPPPPPQAASAAPAAAAKAPTLALPPPAKAASAHPPMGCPMAGTFYRCPAPGEPPFVKVGDKVQKGQVVCIIEAMKLMNEIEADKSGTIVEVVAEDGKPVTIGTPLFVIAP